jgi:hypothetical protein
MQVITTRNAQPRDKPANAHDILRRDKEEFVREAENTLDNCHHLFLCLHRQERLLTEGIARHESKLLEVETRLSKWELALADQEEAMKRQEEALQRQFEKQREGYTKLCRDMDDVLEERQNIRILEAESIMEEIVEKEGDQIAELTRRLEEFTKQAQQTYTETLKKNTREFLIKTKARMDAAALDALDALKANLAQCERVQQMSIEEFCLGHIWNLRIDPVGDSSNMKGIPYGVWFTNESRVSLL